MMGTVTLVAFSSSLYVSFYIPVLSRGCFFAILYAVLALVLVVPARLRRGEQFSRFQGPV